MQQYSIMTTFPDHTVKMAANADDITAGGRVSRV